jgi:predicted site-specific integrase-resolvase
MKITSAWVTQRAAADGLGVSERTLHRWRSAGLLKPGEHFRRKFPAANSPLLYQLERCEKAMNDAFARDHRTLELARV